LSLLLFDNDVQQITDKDGNNLFHYAARNCNDKLMFKWLYQNKVNAVKKNNFGQTPFLVACYYSNATMIEMFLELNASNVLWHAFLEDQDNDGNTGLHYAVQNADLKSKFIFVTFLDSVRSQRRLTELLFIFILDFSCVLASEERPLT
jgi:ankyrin repeat protein